MMLGYLIFTLAGALIFAAGVMFERDILPQEESEDDEAETEVSPMMLKQWENLLGYDGNKQEGYDEDM